MATPIKDRVRQYRERQASKDLVEVRVFVPAGTEARIKTLAKRLRDSTVKRISKKPLDVTRNRE